MKKAGSPAHRYDLWTVSSKPLLMDPKARAGRYSFIISLILMVAVAKVLVLYSKHKTLCSLQCANVLSDVEIYIASHTEFKMC